jgi:hypothetical protein
MQVAMVTCVGDGEILRNRARIARRAGRKTKKNPYFPGIRCAGIGCRKRARECYFFCSSDCRDSFVIYRHGQFQCQ